MADITGGCLCGKVRYTAKAEPVFQGVCHCTDCQRQAGTAFSVVAAFAAPDVTITGEMKTYRGVGSSGNEVLRRFCGECGSPIVSEPATAPGMLFMKAGTFDDTSRVDPKVHIWCDSKQNWVPIPDGAMTFGKSPN
jgi:hypothetical protein